MRDADKIHQIAALAARDPDFWARHAWPCGEANEPLSQFLGPRRWQTEINQVIRDHLSDPFTRFDPLLISVASGHGVGKSAYVGMLANWAVSTCPGAKIVITANTEPQLKTKTSPEVAKWFRMSLTADWFDMSAMSISAKDRSIRDWRVNFITWSKDNTEAFAGLHNVGKRIVLVFDEASAIDDRVWEVAEGALTDANTEIIWLVFGNPTRASGRFRECFRKFRHRWITKQIDSRTVEGVNLDHIKKWEEDFGEDSDFFKVRVRGVFPSLSAKQFISIQDLDAAYGRILNYDQYSFAPKILALDPAYEGDDRLVIGMRQGLNFQILRVVPKNDNDVHIANVLANLEDEHQADAVFIDAGYGTGIKSVGQTLGRDWKLVWFAGASADVGCLNKRAEMYKLVREWLKEGGCLPEDPELYEELSAIETVARLDGKIQLESKKEMKARGLASPDKSDTLAITFAYPVSPKLSSAVFKAQAGQNHAGHDPMELIR